MWLDIYNEKEKCSCEILDKIIIKVNKNTVTFEKDSPKTFF